MLRAYVEWLTKERLVDEVARRVPPATAALMRSPPLAGTWIDRKDVAPIVVAVDQIAGTSGVRRMSTTALRGGIAARLRPALTRILAFLGTSPATLYKRMDDVLRTTIEGIHSQYTETSERSGVVEVRYDLNEEVPLCSFIALMASLEAALDFCEVKGVVGEPERTGPASVRFKIRW
jgi:hypothetical protein